jgi:hypothetical protein
MNNRAIRILATALLLGLGLARESIANIMAPLGYGTTHGIVDEFGNLLEGTGSSPGARVEILDASHGVYPPNADGTPHPSNEVLAITQIGAGTDPGAGPMGKTAGALIVDRTKQTPIFARVFNRATREDASFYADSGVYVTPTAQYGLFMIDVAATTNALDAGDDDGDGLNNSWEKSLGTEKNNADTDGDGISDGDERRSGTDPLDAESYLMMVKIKGGSGSQIVAEWDAVAGKTYQLQHAEITEGGGEYAFSNVNEAVTATGPVASTTVTNLPPGVFRVFLVE